MRDYVDFKEREGKWNYLFHKYLQLLLSHLH